MHSYIPGFRSIVTKKKKTGLTVTVSGLSGSGKTTVSRYLAKMLNLRYFSPGMIIREEAKKNNMKLADFTRKNHDSLQMMVDKKVLELASSGGYILDGRVTGWVAGDYADIRLFITAPPGERYMRISGREKISLDDAKSVTLRRDNNDARTYKNLYNIDLFDISIYTLIVDTTGLKPGECDKIVFDAIEKIL